MIKFHGAESLKEISTLNLPESYRNIRPQNETSVQSTEKFWDQVFSAKSEIETVSEENILTNIFDVGNKSFEFEFSDVDINAIRKILEKFQPDQWIELTASEKEQLILKLTDYLTEVLEVPKTPTVDWFDGPETNCGAFNQSTGKIELNLALLHNPTELVDTVTHEMRHAYQHYRANKQETFTDLLYKANFDNYISPVPIGDGKYLFYTDYYDQLVEVEARAYAKVFTALGGKL